jgi:hypothetical protein
VAYFEAKRSSWPTSSLLSEALTLGEMVYSFLHAIDPKLGQTVESTMVDLLGRFSNPDHWTHGVRWNPLDAFWNGAPTISTHR